MDETQDAAPSSTEPVAPVVEFVAPAIEAADAAPIAADAELAASHAEWTGNDAPASTGATSLDAAVSAEHPAHALADQIGEHMAALDGSGDSLMARIAAEVKRLVGEIKEAL